MFELLLLAPDNYEKNKPTKILDKNLNKINSFDSGFGFYFETISYSSIHEAMDRVFAIDSVFMVLGELTDFGQNLEETRNSGPRRKKKGIPTIRDKNGCELVLDLDDHILEDFDCLDPEPAIKLWLKQRKINCDVTWQITSGQKLNTEEARIRLYFQTVKKHSLEHRKAWSQSPAIMADGSVYTCSQPIYTAPPIIEGGKDPIKQRNGFIRGRIRLFKLPKLDIEKIKLYSRFQRGDTNYDFNDPDLPKEVKSGKVYRRYFMPLAFHYANLLKGDREAIFHIISGKARQVKKREFSAENVYSYIDDALDRIESEVEEEQNDDNLLKAKDFKKELEASPVPEFPEDLLSGWPDPWPMLWENFKRIPRQLEEPLLVPTIIALNAFFLKSEYVTAYHRRPNMFFLNLTPSTGNKDVNSKNVIRDLAGIFKQRGSLSSLFSGLVTTESSITADTTFLQSFNEADEFFWINTEATRIFQQIKNGAGNSNVAALSDKLIEVVDGHEITGKIKAAGKVKTIENPNAQILFYAQPETIEKYIDEEMVDSGLFGRSLLSIVPDLGFDAGSYTMFLNRDFSRSSVDDEFYEFYTSQKFGTSNLGHAKTVLKLNKKNTIVLNSWARDFVAPLMEKDESYQKVLSRIGNAAEQLYCIILGICQKYDAHMEQDVRKDISVLPLIPLLEYWTTTKVYAMENFIHTALDPMADAILVIIQKCLTGGYKIQRATDLNVIKTRSMVRESLVLQQLRNNTKLIRKLSADNDKRNAISRAEQIIRSMVNMGVIKRELIKDKNGGSANCLGLIA